MKLDNYEQPLIDYLKAITLTKTQDDRINSALEKVLAVMLIAFPDAEVYAQGSYSTDTLVKPLTLTQGSGSAGEYDIDIVVERADWDGAVSALDEVADLLEEDGTYSRMLIDRSKNSCVRIEYVADGGGIGFHVDLVPTKNTGGVRAVPNRETDDWKHSDAKAFADWFNDKAELNPGLRQMALIIKRIRDLNGLTDNLKSILVLALVEKNYFSTGTIMGDLLAVLDGIAMQLPVAERPPFIANPINAGEDLGSRIENYNEARGLFVDTRAKLVDSITEGDADGLKEVFGPGFPYVTISQKDSYNIPATVVQPTRAYGASGEQVND